MKMKEDTRKKLEAVLPHVLNKRMDYNGLAYNVNCYGKYVENVDDGFKHYSTTLAMSTFMKYAAVDKEEGPRKEEVTIEYVVDLLNDLLYDEADRFTVEDGKIYLNSDESMYTVRGLKE